MDILPSVVNALIAAVAVAFVTFITRSQYRDLKEGYKELRNDTKDGIARLDTRLDNELASIRSEIAGLRSDITQVALAVGTQLRPQTG